VVDANSAPGRRRLMSFSLLLLATKNRVPSCAVWVSQPNAARLCLPAHGVAHVRDRVGCAGAQGSSAEFDRATFLQSSKVSTAGYPL